MIFKKKKLPTVQDTHIPSGFSKGDILLDVYEVLDRPIEGGMGRVYKVKHKNWDIDLALKQPLLDKDISGRIKQRFKAECETWINLGLHPNIISCFYTREVDGLLSIFSEWADGGSLLDWEKNSRIYQGHETEIIARIIDIAIQSARGIGFAHKNELIHQDIKPANILMMNDGTLKITDFGISSGRAFADEQLGTNVNIKNNNETMLFQTGGGTPAYAAPEQLVRDLSRGVLTRRSDIWSWALTILELFVVNKSWDLGIEVLNQIDKVLKTSKIKMPESLKDLLWDCLRIDEKDRPHDFEEIEEKLLFEYKNTSGHEYFRKKWDQPSTSAEFYNNRALSLLDIAENENEKFEAIELWDKALDLDSNQLEARYNRALYKWRIGQIDDIEVINQISQTKEQNNWKTSYYLAEINLERGDYSKAIECIERISGLQEIPENVMGLHRKAVELLSTITPPYRLFSGNVSKYKLIKEYLAIISEEKKIHLYSMPSMQFLFTTDVKIDVESIEIIPRLDIIIVAGHDWGNSISQDLIEAFKLSTGEKINERALMYPEVQDGVNGEVDLIASPTKDIFLLQRLENIYPIDEFVNEIHLPWTLDSDDCLAGYIYILNATTLEIIDRFTPIVKVIKNYEESTRDKIVGLTYAVGAFEIGFIEEEKIIFLAGAPRAIEEKFNIEGMVISADLRTKTTDIEMSLGYWDYDEMRDYIYKKTGKQDPHISFSGRKRISVDQSGRMKYIDIKTKQCICSLENYIWVKTLSSGRESIWLYGQKEFYSEKVAIVTHEDGIYAHTLPEILVPADYKLSRPVSIEIQIENERAFDSAIKQSKELLDIGVKQRKAQDKNKKTQEMKEAVNYYNEARSCEYRDDSRLFKLYQELAQYCIKDGIENIALSSVEKVYDVFPIPDDNIILANQYFTSALRDMTSISYSFTFSDDYNNIGFVSCGSFISGGKEAIWGHRNWKIKPHREQKFSIIDLVDIQSSMFFPQHISFIPETDYVLLAFEYMAGDYKFEIIDLKENKVVFYDYFEAGGKILFSRTQNFFMLTRDGVLVYSLDPYPRYQQFITDGRVVDITLDRTGKRLYILYKDATMSCLDTKDFSVLSCVKLKGENRHLVVSFDESIIITGYDDNVYFWDAKSGELIQTIWTEVQNTEGRDERIVSMTLSSDGSLLWVKKEGDKTSHAETYVFTINIRYNLIFPGWSDYDEKVEKYFDEFFIKYPDWDYDNKMKAMFDLQNLNLGWVTLEGLGQIFNAHPSNLKPKKSIINNNPDHPVEEARPEASTKKKLIEMIDKGTP